MMRSNTKLMNQEDLISIVIAQGLKEGLSAESRTISLGEVIMQFQTTGLESCISDEKEREELTRDLNLVVSKGQPPEALNHGDEIITKNDDKWLFHTVLTKEK